MIKKSLKPIVDVYEENADFWASQRARSGFFEKKYMSQVLSSLQVGDAILDIGCGTGEPIAQYFLDQGMEVTGVDASFAMINRAQRKYPKATWLRADMTTLRLDTRFSAIIAWDSFFHLKPFEQEKMFPIFRAHLLAGGFLVFTSGPERGEAIGDMNGESLYHSSLAPEEYRELLRKNAFEEISFQPNDTECGGHSVWVCRALDEGIASERC